MKVFTKIVKILGCFRALEEIQLSKLKTKSILVQLKVVEKYCQKSKNLILKKQRNLEEIKIQIRYCKK